MCHHRIMYKEKGWQKTSNLCFQHQVFVFPLHMHPKKIFLGTSGLLKSLSLTQLDLYYIMAKIDFKSFQFLFLFIL